MRVNLAKWLPLMLYIAVTTPARAQNDCREGLRPDIINFVLDEETSLSFLWLATDDEFNERKKKGNGSLGIGVYQASFGNQSSQSARRQKLQKMGYNHNQNTSLTYFASQVSDATRKDFFKCVQHSTRVQPFFLDVKENWRDEKKRSMELSLQRFSPIGDDGDEFELSWKASDADLSKDLKESFPRIAAGDVSITHSFDLDLDKGANITAYRLRANVPVFSVNISVPPVPKTRERVEERVSVWKERIYSIPVKVKTHRAHIGDRWGTTNFNADLVDDGSKTDTRVLLRDQVVASNNQEIELDWDRAARQVSQLPEILSDDELNFEFRCGFAVPVAQLVFYPSSDNWLPAGQKCGDQNANGGSPIMTHLWVRAVGSKAAEFRVKLSCMGRGQWSGPSSDCVITTGIEQFRLEIDSVGPG